MKHSLFAAATLAVVAVGPAAAQDWSGFYVGAQGGYLWGDVDHSYTPGGAPPGTSDLAGAVVGGHLGWQTQTSGGWLFGIEGDGEWSSADGAYDDTTGVTSAGAAEIDWQASARARLGYAGGSWLVYATGGGAFGSFDFLGGPSPSCVCGALSGFSSTEIGWTAGGGIEVMVGPNFSVGAEYRYTDYGAESDVLPAFPATTMTVDSTSHAIRGRLTLHM
jgi:outer membrane immunogenic protein